MVACLFLAIGGLFSWMVFKAVSTRSIQGRGWGFGTRTYRRDGEPIRYWVTFASYLVCAVWATAFGLLAAFRRLAGPA
jgi:hypothetical protein